MARKGNHTMVDVQCFFCGVDFQRALTDFNTTKNRGGNQFCSKSCRGLYGVELLRKKYKVTEEDFWNCVNKEPGQGPNGDCWEWVSTLDAGGYGATSFSRDSRMDGKKGTQKAHRVSYMLLVGSIPEGKALLHSCDNRKCVRPDHLRPGDAKDNMQDALARKRVVVGEDRACATLTNDQVVEIKLLLMLGYAQSYLSKRFAVDDSVLYGIASGRNWSSILVSEDDLKLRPDLIEQCKKDKLDGLKDKFIRSLRKEIGANAPKKTYKKYVSPW